jgi:hypothetical protein
MTTDPINTNHLKNIVEKRDALHDKLAVKMKTHGELIDLIFSLVSADVDNAHEIARSALTRLTQTGDDHLVRDYMDAVAAKPIP